MFFWFVGGAVAIVWSVFKDPALDFRVIIAGALLPDVLDGADHFALPFHSVCVVAVVLGVVMIGTRAERTRRRRWLALPIGMFVHLILDATWSTPVLFWWPLFGLGRRGQALPAVDHGVVVIVVEELAGLVALGWAWRRFALGGDDRRAAFLQRGSLREG